jgi:hypothetical protein
MRRPRKSDIDKFIALSDLEKERIVKQIDAETPQQRLARSRPLNARERAQWRRFKAKMGRPRIGKGAKTISLTVEAGLLEQADAYAKKQGLSRANVVAQGLRAVIGLAT